ncbi:MAG: ABC transporter permease [Deltaproteobacteria bacterium]|nr:ABC transporter permease [Deltaproteobacteria bacterium]
MVRLPWLARTAFNKIRTQAEQVGAFLLFLAEIAQQALRLPFRRHEIFRQIEFVGNQSLMIILLTGFATGAVFGLQIGGIFTIFRAEGIIGGATGIALSTELAPLVTGFLLAGRAGSAMTAEISTMVVNEQVDALEAMGISPIHYLVVPRVLASMFIMPFLCGLFMFAGIAGVWMIGRLLFNVDEGIFMDKLISMVQSTDIIKGLRKMFFFSFIISATSCRYGLNASKGAKGVGLATTNAVVHTLLLILVMDFMITWMEVRWLS